MDAARASASTGSGMTAIAVWMRSEPRGEPKLASMLVIVGPGATAFTRMPLGPYMNALLLVRPATACLEAVYATPAAEPRRAASDAVFTIEPPPWASIAGMTARMSFIVPFTFTRKTRSHTASDTSPTGVMSSMIPAMFARPSITSPAAAMMRATPASSVMSAVSETISAPA